MPNKIDIKAAYFEGFQRGLEKADSAYAEGLPESAEMWCLLAAVESWETSESKRKGDK